MMVAPPRVPTPRLKARPIVGTSKDVAAAAVSTSTNASAATSGHSTSISSNNHLFAAPHQHDTAYARRNPTTMTTAVSASARQTSQATLLRRTATGTTTTATTTTTAMPRIAHVINVDPLSDKATISLIRRTLCVDQPWEKSGGSGSAAPALPSGSGGAGGATGTLGPGGAGGTEPGGTTAAACINDILPPLTSRNDVDLQLYALLAIGLREFVQSWYSRLTPDREFVDELVRLTAHVTRALEQRLRAVDLRRLVLDDLPVLLRDHVEAYRLAHDPPHTPQTAPRHARQIYHALHQLPQLEPVPPDPATGPSGSVAALVAANEATYRQLLVQAMLTVLLPTEDLRNPCLTALLNQLLAEMVIGSALIDRLAPPVSIWAAIASVQNDRTPRRKSASSSTTKAAPTHVAHARNLSAAAVATTTSRTTTRADETRPNPRTAVSSPLLGLGQKYKPPTAPTTPASSSDYSYSSTSSTFYALLATLLAFLNTVLVILRHLANLVNLATSLPSRACTSHTPSTKPQLQGKPILLAQLPATLTTLLELDVRMPFLFGALRWLLWIATARGMPFAFDGLGDRLLAYGIDRVFEGVSELVPGALLGLRGAVFPGNAVPSPPAPAPAPHCSSASHRRQFTSSAPPPAPTPTQIRRDAATVLWTHTPPAGRAALRLLLLGTRHVFGVWWGGNSLKHSTSRHHIPPRRHHEVQNTESLTPLAPNGAAPFHVGADNAKEAAPEVSLERVGGGQGGAPEVPRAQQENDMDAAVVDELASRVLDVFGDEYCNRHLLYRILELVVVQLLPELAEKSLSELMEERLGNEEGSDGGKQ